MNAILDKETQVSFSILDAMPDGVYLTDSDRQIIFWNRAAERMTGWKRNEVVGRRCSDNLLVPIDKDSNILCRGNRCPLFRSILTGASSERPILVFAQTKTGARIPVEVSVAPLRTAQGDIIGGVEIFRDVTEAIQDLDRARLIQKSAMRSKLVQDSRLRIATRCVPRDAVGGDFMHVEQLDADHYVVFMADVTGHGVAAALYTMQLRALWEEYRHHLGDPTQFLEALNARFHTLANKNDYFATGVHCVIDAATGIITYASAGHVSPLLIKENRNIFILSQKDSCLGLFDKTVYHPVQERMEVGDSLILYTDGATEIDDAAGNALGMDGFCHIAYPQDYSNPEMALERIERELLKYCGQIHLPDDLSLLCLYRSK